MTSTHEALIAARAVIADPANWAQGHYRNPNNGCRCAIGAVATTYGDNWKVAERCEVTQALDAQALVLLNKPAAHYIAGYPTISVNDALEPIAKHQRIPRATAHDYVMLMFDRAIKASTPDA